MLNKSEKVANVHKALNLAVVDPDPPLDPGGLETFALRDAYAAEIGKAFGQFVDNVETDTPGALSKFENALGFAKSCYRKALEIVKRDF